MTVLRAVTDEALGLGGSPDDRVLVHFGAVDYRAEVWFDGQHVVSHVGGQTPFTADVTDAMARDVAEHVIVVRPGPAPGQAGLE